MSLELELNGMRFVPLPGVKYRTDYLARAEEHESGRADEREVWRKILQSDTWAIVYFLFQMENANHPFVVNACREVDEGPQTRTLDIWAREHFKSTIFTKAQPIKRILNNPNERICIFGYSRALALMFLRSVKFTFETSDWLKWLFPEIFYQRPEKEAPTWGEETGIVVKRKGNPNEATLEAWGLVEGMPTGRHFTGRIYDDIETPDLVHTPEMSEKVKEQFDMSENVGAEGGWETIVGTFYSHNGPLCYIRDKRDPDGRSIYYTRVKPATDDGTAKGNPVLLSMERLTKLRTNLKTFYSQQLCDPTPRGEEKLKWDHVKRVTPAQLPEQLYKFMVVDPAGERRADKRSGDAWSILVFGVEPIRDLEIGAANVYLLDGTIAEMSESDALREVVSIFCRNGRILRLGVEKVAMMTAEIHIANALRARGRYVSEEAGTLVALRPGGRNKKDRILQNVMWPLDNGKFHICSTTPPAVVDRLKSEFEKFPVWHDDGLDTCAYLYDMIRDYRFASLFVPQPKKEVKRDAWDDAFNDDDEEIRGWLTA